MSETFILLFRQITRNLLKKMKEAPLLYLFFSAMIVFSIIMFGYLTLFLLKTETEINLLDVFYGVFFLFVMKTASDVHTHFISSSYLTYSLSSDRPQKKTVQEIYLTIIFLNISIWFSFSGLYLLTLYGIGIDISYPVEYLLYSLGVMSGILLGCVVGTHFFSPFKYRLLPTVFLLAFYWFGQHLYFIITTFPLVVLHFWWCLYHAMDSYLYINRKERTKDASKIKQRSILHTLCYREITVLWRDKLLYSFVFTAIATALFTGYLSIYGTDLLIPESLQQYAKGYLPEMFVFLGVYIVIIYTSVFPALNLFLNEEKTMWILRNLPLTTDSIIMGKTLALLLCFLTTLPFLAYIAIFIGVDNLLFLLWLLVFSYIAGMIISIPLGAKYVGKKSDILLLYTIAIILFAFLAIAGNIGLFIQKWLPGYAAGILLLGLVVEILVLYLSLKESARIIQLY